MSEILSVEDLSIEYVHHRQGVAAVRNVSFKLNSSETLGLVGESGCGKSTLALSLIGLLPKPESRVRNGRIIFEGQDLLLQNDNQWRNTRGQKVAMIFQDPFSALNPVLTVKYQIQEAIELKLGRPDKQAALQLLEQVQLSDPERILESYPHQLSGGQRQRVLIAIALARHPQLLIADEPTTALDVTIQDEIVKLLIHLQKTLKMAMIFVTHNMGLIKNMADNLAVMYAGQIVEYGKTPDVLSNPKHPYTQGLLRCLPTLKRTRGPIPVLQGQPPEPHHLPTGCPFHPRCEKVFEPCATQDPNDRIASQQRVRCHLYGA